MIGIAGIIGRVPVGGPAAYLGMPQDARDAAGSHVRCARIPRLPVLDPVASQDISQMRCRRIPRMPWDLMGFHMGSCGIPWEFLRKFRREFSVGAHGMPSDAFEFSHCLLYTSDAADE